MEQGPMQTVTLVRMATAEIQDRRRMFELFNSLKVCVCVCVCVYIYIYISYRCRTRGAC